MACACVLPCGFAGVGLQIVAKPWGDYTTIAVAEYLQNALGGWKSVNTNEL